MAADELRGVRGRAGSILLLAMSVLVLLALSEAVLRWLRPEEPPIRFVQLDRGLRGDEAHDFVRYVEADPDLFWRLAPDVELPDDAGPLFGLISNGQGLREDHEISRERGEDELRILFLGDSNTFGYKLSASESFVARIEQRLAERHPRLRVECINAGVPGYAIFQGWQLLRRHGAAWQPDLVVASFGWNDITQSDGLSDLEQHARMQAARPPVLAGSRLVTLAWRLLRPLPDVSGRPPRPRLWAAEHRDLLDQMREEAHALDADLLALVWAVRWNAPRSRKHLRTPHQRVQLDFGREFRLRDGATPSAFDAVPLVQELGDAHDLDELFFDRNHARAIVHERLAEAFVAWLEPWLAWRLAQRGLSLPAAVTEVAPERRTADTSGEDAPRRLPDP